MSHVCFLKINIICDILPLSIKVQQVKPLLSKYIVKNNPTIHIAGLLQHKHKIKHDKTTLLPVEVWDPHLLPLPIHIEREVSERMSILYFYFNFY